jgi:hypothetical protein
MPLAQRLSVHSTHEYKNVFMGFFKFMDFFPQKISFLKTNDRILNI